MVVGVHINSIVRACLRACFAADAPPVVKIDNAVLSCEQSRNRTDLNTWCVSAMIAPHYREQPSGIRELAFLNVLDPRPVHADRHFVLRLARNGAGVAPDTLPVIDDKAVVHLIAEWTCKF